MDIEWRVSDRPNLHTSADFKNPVEWRYLTTLKQMRDAEQYIKTKGNPEHVYQVERWVQLITADGRGPWELDLKQRKQDDYAMYPYVEKWAWNPRDKWHRFTRDQYATAHQDVPANVNRNQPFVGPGKTRIK